MCIIGLELAEFARVVGVLDQEATHSSLRLRRVERRPQKRLLSTPHTHSAGTSDGPETAKHLGLLGSGSGDID